MERQPVTSSMIKSVGFDGTAMHIEFPNGKVYEYTGPMVAQHHANMMAADSIGKYFGANVRRCPHTVCTQL